MGSFCRRLQGAVLYKGHRSAVSSEWLADESPLMLEDRRSLLVGVVNRMNSEKLIALPSKINPIAKKLGVGSANLVPAADAWLRSNTFLWGRGSPSEMSGMLELLGEQAISTAAVSRLREGSTSDFNYKWDQFDSYLSLVWPSDRDALWADPTFCSRFGSRLLKLLEDYKSQRGDTASEALKLVALVPDSMKLDEESRKAFGKNLFALSCVYREQPIFDGCVRLGVAPASKLRALWYRMNRGT